MKESRVLVFVDCPHDAASKIQNCMFSKVSHDVAPNLTVVSDAALIQLPFYGGWMIDCGSNFPKKGHSEVESDLQASVGLVLKNNETVDPIPVEVIAEGVRGDIVICTRATSDHPDLYRYLDHYRALGVDHFHINYMFTNTSHMQKSVGHKNKLFHFGGPAKIVDASDVTWKFGGKDTHLAVLSLYLQVNECIHRYKYSYRYAMAIDLDEYLVLNASLRGYPRLVEILDNLMPEDKVAFKLCRMHYSRTCPSEKNGDHVVGGPGGARFFAHWKRDPTPDCGFGKSIMRPKYVKVTYTHYPLVYIKESVKGVIDWPTSMGYFQHWSARQKESSDMDMNDCNSLQKQSETFLSDIWFV